ncbi:MAG: hypothetical protein ABI567_00610 [Gammaproteobacteria bacterium]
MQLKLIAVIALALLPAALVQSATATWLDEFALVRAPQTRVVRHPIDKSRYYLCWQEGTSRFGLAFQKGKLDDQLRALRPGGSTSLATMFTLSKSTWTAADEKICWGNAA